MLLNAKGFPRKGSPRDRRLKARAVRGGWGSSEGTSLAARVSVPT